MIGFALAVIGGPIAGFTRAARDPDTSRLALFAGAILGGLAVGTVIGWLPILNLALSPAASYAGAATHSSWFSCRSCCSSDPRRSSVVSGSSRVASGAGAAAAPDTREAHTKRQLYVRFDSRAASARAMYGHSLGCSDSPARNNTISVEARDRAGKPDRRELHEILSFAFANAPREERDEGWAEGRQQRIGGAFVPGLRVAHHSGQLDRRKPHRREGGVLGRRTGLRRPARLPRYSFIAQSVLVGRPRRHDFAVQMPAASVAPGGWKYALILASTTASWSARKGRA